MQKVTTCLENVRNLEMSGIWLLLGRCREMDQKSGKCQEKNFLKWFHIWGCASTHWHYECMFIILWNTAWVARTWVGVSQKVIEMEGNFTLSGECWHWKHKHSSDPGNFQNVMGTSLSKDTSVITFSCKSHYSLQIHTGWAKKSGPFLKVHKSCVWWRTKWFNVSKCSTVYQK